MSFTAHAEYFWKAVRQEATLARLIPSLVTSLVVAMMTVVLSISFVALIFVGPIESLVGEGPT